MNQVFRNEYKAASINTTSRLVFYILTNRILAYIIQDNKAIIKTTNNNKINENINSLNFEMDTEDYKKMNLFRAEEFDNIVIDWEGKGGITVDQLANQFE